MWLKLQPAVNIATFLRHSPKTISRPVALSQVICFRFWPKDIFKCELYPKRKSSYVYSRLGFRRKKSKDRFWGLWPLWLSIQNTGTMPGRGHIYLKATVFISRSGARKKALKGLTSPCVGKSSIGHGGCIRCDQPKWFQEHWLKPAGTGGQESKFRWLCGSSKGSW